VGTVTVELRANRHLEREIVALRRENQKRDARNASVSPAVSGAEPLALLNIQSDELAQLRARITELKARPEGVVDSEIKRRDAWKDAGRATPEAAIETFIWAATHDRFDSLAASFVFGEETKKEADAFFAKLSPEIRAKYETPERLFAPYVVSGAKQREVDAMQVLEVRDGSLPDEANVRYWVRFPDGTGHEDTLPFRKIGDGWRMGHRGMGISIPTAAEFLRTHFDSEIVVSNQRNE
jgi:hypothetical protein